MLLMLPRLLPVFLLIGNLIQRRGRMRAHLGASCCQGPLVPPSDCSKMQRCGRSPARTDGIGEASLDRTHHYEPKITRWKQYTPKTAICQAKGDDFRVPRPGGGRYPYSPMVFSFHAPAARPLPRHGRPRRAAPTAARLIGFSVGAALRGCPPFRCRVPGFSGPPSLHPAACRGLISCSRFPLPRPACPACLAGFQVNGCCRSGCRFPNPESRPARRSLLA